MFRSFQQRTHAAGPAAMTLVEVLVAVLILTTVVYGAVAFMTNGRTQVTWATQQRAAAHIAMEQLERARAAGYDAVDYDYGMVTLDGNDYSWNLYPMILQADPGDPNSTYKHLEVTVYWFDGLSGRTLTFYSAISP